MAHDEKHDKEWRHFKSKYLSPRDSDKTKLLELLATDKEFAASNCYYASFFQHVKPGFFDFVGCVETLDDDTAALNRSLGVSLTLPHANKSVTNTIETESGVAHHLRSEAELIKTFLTHAH